MSARSWPAQPSIEGAVAVSDHTLVAISSESLELMASSGDHQGESPPDGSRPQTNLSIERPICQLLFTSLLVTAVDRAYPRCWPLLSSSIGETSVTGAKELAPEEGQQVGVDLLLMRGREAVRRARIVDFLGALDEPRRLHRRVLDGNDLVVLPVHDQGRDIDLLEVLGKIGLGEGLDAFVGVLKAGLHAPQPELIQRALGDLGARPVGATERCREVLVELRAVLREAAPQVVEHLHRQAL